MKLIGMKKVWSGKYLNNYLLTYLNKNGEQKDYEIVSRHAPSTPKELGLKTSGVSIVAFRDDSMVLLKEFRMSVNRYIYNLIAGMLEEGETLEECIHRELYEETGLRVREIKEILPASYAAVGISDIKTNTAFVEVEGEISDHTSPNESIEAAFYTRNQLEKMLKTEVFSSRSQMAAWHFVNSR